MGCRPNFEDSTAGGGFVEGEEEPIEARLVKGEWVFPLGYNGCLGMVSTG